MLYSSFLSLFEPLGALTRGGAGGGVFLFDGGLRFLSWVTLCGGSGGTKKVKRPNAIFILQRQGCVLLGKPAGVDVAVEQTEGLRDTVGCGDDLHTGDVFGLFGFGAVFGPDSGRTDNTHQQKQGKGSDA